MTEEKKAVQCPSCQGPAIKEGNEITCEPCDATFTVTKTGAARVKDTGKIEDHEKRITELESRSYSEQPPDRKGAGDGGDVSEESIIPE